MLGLKFCELAVCKTLVWYEFVREVGQTSAYVPVVQPQPRKRDYSSCAAQLQRESEQSLAHHPNHLGEPAASDSIRALRNATKE